MLWQNGQFTVEFGPITSVTLITRKGRIHPNNLYNHYSPFTSPRQLVLYMSSIAYKNKPYVTT